MDPKDQGSEMVMVEEPVEAEAEPIVTVEDAQAAELDPREIEAGKKAGVLTEPPAPEADPKPEAEAEPAPEPPKKKREYEPAPWEKDMTDEERANFEKFSPNEKALYRDRKKERYKRQEAQDERDQMRAQLAFYKGKAETLEKMQQAPPSPKDGATEPELDEFGDPVDPNHRNGEGDKPLTLSDLERIEKEKQERERKAQEESFSRRDALIKTLDEQEREFKQEKPDFENVFENFTKDIIHANVQKLEQLFPKRVEREGVKMMVADWLRRLREPEKYSGEQSAAAVAYEIGQLHPKFSDADPDAAGGEDDDDGEQGHGAPNRNKADLEKRLGHHSRPSSAPLSGGANRRPKSVNDLTVEDLAFMSTDQIRALKSKHPNAVERILREG